jgi:hypothetical protein
MLAIGQNSWLWLKNTPNFALRKDGSRAANDLRERLILGGTI